MREKQRRKQAKSEQVDRGSPQKVVLISEKKKNEAEK